MAQDARPASARRLNLLLIFGAFRYGSIHPELKVLTYEDCLLLPKGEKIAKILRVR